MACINQPRDGPVMPLSVRKAAARYFGGEVSLRTVYRLVESGDVRSVRVRGRLLIYPDSLEAYLAGRTRDPAPDPQPAAVILPPPTKKGGRRRRAARPTMKVHFPQRKDP